MPKPRPPLAPLTAGAQVVAYIRDSGGPAQDRSVDEQRAELSAYADAHGYAIVQWFVDEALSGATDDRPAFQCMIALCRSDDRPAAVLMWSLSRFGRNEQDGPYYRADLRRRGVEVVAIGQPVPAGPMGNIYEAMLDWHNANFLDDLRRDVQRGHLAVLRQGYIVGGRPPVGYVAVRAPLGQRRDGAPRYGVRWEIDPQTAPRVREAFAMRAAGATLAEIHQTTHLHRNMPGYSAMFARTTYRGLYTYGAQEFPGLVPALIDDATWQAAYDRRKEHRPPRVASSHYLLSGMVVCGYCGQRVHGCSRRNRTTPTPTVYYRCIAKEINACASHYVRAEIIDRAVVEEVLVKALDPLAVEAVIAAAQARAATTDHTAALTDLAARIAAIEKAIAALLDLAEHGAALVEVRVRLRERETELAQLRNQHATLTADQAQTALSPDILRATFAALATDLRSPNIPLARRALAHLVARVELRDYDITIIYR